MNIKTTINNISARHHYEQTRKGKKRKIAITNAFDCKAILEILKQSLLGFWERDSRIWINPSHRSPLCRNPVQNYVVISLTCYLGKPLSGLCEFFFQNYGRTSLRRQDEARILLMMIEKKTPGETTQHSVRKPLKILGGPRSLF